MLAGLLSTGQTGDRWPPDCSPLSTSSNSLLAHFACLAPEVIGLRDITTLS